MVMPAPGGSSKQTNLKTSFIEENLSYMICLIVFTL